MKFVTKEFEEKMKKTISAYESRLSTIRAGQANAGVLANVSFEYYGAPTPLATMADIRCADSMTHPRSRQWRRQFSRRMLESPPRMTVS